MGDMSKALSLAGLRMGWIIDADPERRKRIIDARSYFTICSSPILEAIAIHALAQQERNLLAKLMPWRRATWPRCPASCSALPDVLHG